MKHMSKRLGCAALAAQLLLTPAAQAAQPLRQLLEEDARSSVISHSASFLEQKKQRQTTFPQLRRLASTGVKTVALGGEETTPVDSGAADQGTSVDNDMPSAGDTAVDSDTATDGDNPVDSDEPSDGDAAVDSDTPVDSDAPADGDSSVDKDTPADGGSASDNDAPLGGETAPDETTDPDAPTAIPDDKDSPAGQETQPGEGPELSTDADKPDKETTAADTPAGALPAGAEPVQKPEKQLLGRALRRARWSVGLFGIDPDEPNPYSDYLDTKTILAIYGFGPDYRVPREEGALNAEKESKCAYNIEFLSKESESWFAFRQKGTDNETATRSYLHNMLDYGTYPYLYAETHSAKDVRLNFGGAFSDEEFEWNTVDVEMAPADDAKGLPSVEAPPGELQYFIGSLPGTDDGTELPRLPNKEFTGEWYVLGSKEDGSGGVSVTIGDKPSIPYGTFAQYFKGADVDGAFYTRLEYDESRDVLFEDVTSSADNRVGYQTKSRPLHIYEHNSDYTYVPYDPDPDAVNYDQKYIDGNPIAADGSTRAMMDFYGDWDSSHYDTTLPLIGRWKDSTNATLTSLALTMDLRESSGVTTDIDTKLYLVDSGEQTVDKLWGKTYLELQGAKQEFAPDHEEYFLRLPASATSVALKQDEVLSYEPGSTVTLFATYEDGTEVELALDHEEIPERSSGYYSLPENSVTNPARSVWTLDGAAPSIPVVNNKHVLQNIRLHVLPPSKDEADAKDYTIYVKQLKDPELIKDPGNTPMGMIERNDSTEDSLWTPDRKKQSKENFEDRLSYTSTVGTKLQPADKSNNNEGFLWMGTYQPDAWLNATTDTSANVDLDPSAIVVYPNTSFDVPGFSIKDSRDDTIMATEIANPQYDSEDPNSEPRIQNVKWKLELTTVDKLTPDEMVNEDPNSDDAWSGEGDVPNLSLADYKVKPGVYKLCYSYMDEYDGMWHTGGSFDRTVVVLPLHGDVDLDGAVTPADGIALKALLGNDPAAFKRDMVDNGDDTSRLYYFRVCDVSDVTRTGNFADGNVNEWDVELLLQGYSPAMRDTNYKNSDYFYIPLPGGEDREAKAVHTVSDPTGPALSLKYLGAGLDVDDLDATTGVNYDPDVDSVFWMDVCLSNIGGVDAFAGDLTSFTATLTYNSDYVEPYKPEGYDTWGDYILSLNPRWSGWEIQLVRETRLVGDKLVSTEIETDITPVDTPSKALSLLKGWASDSTLREARFSVTPVSPTNTNPLASAGADGSVLKAPFRLKKFPVGATNSSKKLVELALGPRDFVLTTTNNGSAGTALWDNNPIQPSKPSAAPVTDNVNLKDVLAFTGSDEVKLGSDTTPAYYVYVNPTVNPTYATDVDSSSAHGKNLVYGHGQNVVMNSYGVRGGQADKESSRKYFSIGGLDTTIQWSDPSNTPGVVNYDPRTYQLTITPEKAGSFDFTISGNDTPYRLVVDQSVLTLTVDNVKKYYGEAPEKTTAKTFTYDKSQIQALDLADPSKNTGKGSDLGFISGYIEPTITLMTAVGGDKVQANTAPGDYTVVIQGGLSDNYTFKYVRADKAAADKDHFSDKLGTAKLTILPRPLLVDKVTKDPAGILTESVPQQFGIAGAAKTDEFTRVAVDDHTDLTGYDSAKGTIDGVPITPSVIMVAGDTLELGYTGTVKQNEHDPSYGFEISGDKEERVASINAISLTENSKTQNDRYVLKNEATADVLNPSIKHIHPLDETAKASVEKRKMLEMEVVRLPSRMNYTYGQTLDLSQLMVEAYYSDRPHQPVQSGDTLDNLKTRLDIEAFWVDDDTSTPAADAKSVLDGEQLHVADRDGKYLCLRDIGTKSVFAYIGPFHVNKQVLTLTLRTETRYYGETITDWTVGYNFGQLAKWDQLDHPSVSGNIDELTWMKGFVSPTVTPREDKTLTSKPITETTDVGDYYALVSDGVSDDYSFHYARTTSSGTEGTSGEFGYAPLHIERRPILITSVVGSAGSMYHDTRSLFVDPAKAVAGGDSAGFLTALPEKDVVYRTSDFGAYTWDGRWELDHSGSAIAAGDTLTAFYRGEFLDPDHPQMPFYELGMDEPVRVVDVQVTNLRLTGERSKNYLLLFPSEEAATNGWAGNSAEDSQTKGTVYQRKIIKIELSGPTKVNYQYGEPLDLNGLTAKITYEGESGGAPVVENVAYDNITLNGVETTTFKRLGLTLHMGSTNGAEVEDGQRLSVARHNGRFLYVTGPQYSSGDVVNDRTPVSLHVTKKQLHLTASDITRKYGEENGLYEFTFDVNDLAEWDRALLGGNAPSGSADALHKSSTSVALAAVNAPYEDGSSDNRFVPPQFTTLATRTSPVTYPVNDRQPYALNLTGGSMANYEFVMNPGAITVEQRPIQVVKINKDPIYTLSQNAFDDNFAKPGFENVVCTQEELELSLTAGAAVTGDPIVEGDNISLRILKGYVDGSNENTEPNGVGDLAFGESYEIKRNAVIQKIELLTGGDNDNYILSNPKAPGNGELLQKITAPNQAIVHRRIVEAIRVVRNPRKMTYTYGEPLDLNGMLLEITYKKGDSTETVSVDPTAMRDVFINYWDPNERAPLTAGELNTPGGDAILGEHQAATGDHLTIAVDTEGFAHNGKYLMVSARTLAGKPYVDSVLTDEPIVVKPRELTYTLEAKDKDYDHSPDAEGVITLTNIYGTDEVWVKNGTDYTGSVPSDHAFSSGDYAADGYDGVKFTFVDENVSYRLSDGHDIFADLLYIPVEVTDIALAGWDKDNYHINSEVLTDTEQLPGRDGAPSARILPIERPVPVVETALWVDEHTNTVKVLPKQAAEAFGDSQDERNTLHYEYALIYTNELGGIVITDYQDDPYFGGEPVTVETVDYVPDENALAIPSGGGQTLDPEDTLFGTRAALPRGTWIGGLVRIAKTYNYQASAGQSSFDPELQVRENDNNDAQLLASLDAAAKAIEARPLPTPDKETDRQVERLEGPAIKTYTYRFDLVSTSQQKDAEEQEVYVPALEAVWFTDIASYEDERAIDRLVENVEPARYYGYYWDKAKDVSLRFPLVMSEDIVEEIPVEGGVSGERAETLMNPNGTARLYVRLSAPSGGGGAAGNPRHLEIIPEELTLEGPGATAQLRVRVSPANLAEKGVNWTSSDEKVVTVSDNGLVTAVGSGTATITATARKGGVSDSITVTVLGEAKPQGNKYPYGDTMFNSAYLGAFFDLPAGGRFEPERTMTRRELAVVMNRFFQAVEGRLPGEFSYYADLQDGDPRNSAIENLDRWGIVTGVEEEIFAPDQAVTRAEMSVILCRMLMIPAKTDPNAAHAFVDAVPGIHWAWGYIDALAEAGITKGTGDNEYSPERLLTRAEVATFLCRSLITTVDRTKGPIVIPTDVTEGHWAYPSILRAVNSEPAVRLIDKYLPKKESEKK